MTAPMGFVLLTHSKPEQSLFLCQQLTERFDSPPIVMHHDFGKCTLDKSAYPRNVHFVENWSATRWGGWGVVDGALKALRLLYTDDGPEWFVVLSGADYPIMTAADILTSLQDHTFDVYLDNRQIERCDLPIPSEGWGDQNFVAPAWVRLAFERYMAIGFGFYRLAKRLHWKRTAFYLRSNLFVKRLTPFDGTLACYAGDFWLTANRKAAQALLADTEKNRKLLAHFARRPNPDEAFFHTVLGNTEGLEISADNKRYTDWRGCVNHPRTLTEEDFPTLVASGDFFARKFEHAPESLRKLNAMVDRAAATGTTSTVASGGDPASTNVGSARSI